MPKFKDLTGQTFGDLKVIGLSESYSSKKITWNCQCKCGTIVKRITYNLTHNIHPCCLKCSSKENVHSTHKMSKTKLYYIWNGIKSRCYNKRNKSFHNYGERRIIMCNEWKEDFENFQNWSLNNGYVEGLSIDRIDVNGNYEPKNCRWISIAEQSKNRRDNIILEHNGEKKILSEWADYYGINRMLVTQRYEDFFKKGTPINFDKLFFKGRLDTKKVNQYTLSGNYIQTWDSIADAGRNGYDRSGISMCCHNKRKSANGFIWKFESE